MFTDLPRYGLGTAALDWEDPDIDAQSAQMVRLAIKNDMHLIDTSPLYGLGRAEGVMGHALQGIPRCDYLLSTKTGYIANTKTMTAMKTADPRTKRYPPRDYSSDHTRKSIERSLLELGTNYLDIVFIHDPTAGDLHQLKNATVPILEKLRQEKLVRKVGIGLRDVDDAREILDGLEIDILMIAGQHTILIQAADLLLEHCAAKNLPVILAGPMNSGILANPNQPAPRFDYQPAAQEWITRTNQIADLCQDHGVPLRAAALQFPLQDDRIRTVMTGPATMAELEDTDRLKKFPIPNDLWNALQEISP